MECSNFDFPNLNNYTELNTFMLQDEVVPSRIIAMDSPLQTSFKYDEVPSPLNSSVVSVESNTVAAAAAVNNASRCVSKRISARQANKHQVSSSNQQYVTLKNEHEFTAVAANAKIAIMTPSVISGYTDSNNNGNNMIMTCAPFISQPSPQQQQVASVTTATTSTSHLKRKQRAHDIPTCTSDMSQQLNPVGSQANISPDEILALYENDKVRKDRLARKATLARESRQRKREESYELKIEVDELKQLLQMSENRCMQLANALQLQHQQHQQQQFTALPIVSNSLPNVASVPCMLNHASSDIKTSSSNRSSPFSQSSSPYNSGSPYSSHDEEYSPVRAHTSSPALQLGLCSVEHMPLVLNESRSLMNISPVNSLVLSQSSSQYSNSSNTTQSNQDCNRNGEINELKTFMVESMDAMMKRIVELQTIVLNQQQVR